MKYKKKYQKAIIEPEETRLDLPVCEKCSKRLAGYQIDQDDGKVLRVCKDCCISELTSDHG